MRNFVYFAFIILLSLLILPVSCYADGTVAGEGMGYYAEDDLLVTAFFYEVPLVTPPNQPGAEAYVTDEEFMFVSEDIGAETARGVWESFVSYSRAKGFGLTPDTDGGTIAYQLVPAHDEYVRYYGGSHALWLGKMDKNGDFRWLKRYGVLLKEEKIVPAGEVSEAVITPAQQSSMYGWPICYGGSGDDEGYRIAATADGGYVFVGTSGSNDGDVSGNHGMTDVWLAKLGQGRLIEWSRSLGGSGYDTGSAVVAAPDGGFIVTGKTDSNDGDVSGNNGGYDLWIIRVDSAGNPLWQTCIGGEGDDGGTDVILTADGGYLVVGWTSSFDEIMGSAGSRDSWIIKFDGNNEIEWEILLGGQGDDILRDIIAANDGGYIAAGGSDLGNGTYDLWVVKLSESGHMQWEEYYGSSGNDEAYAITSIDSTGYLIAGYTEPDALSEVTGRGARDAIVIKIMNDGQVEWQALYGGSGIDEGHGVLFDPDKGQAVIVGATSSNDGDVSGNRGGQDLWTFALDPVGNLLWQRCIGGTYTDDGESLVRISDGYVLCGYTYSNDIDVYGNHGGSDVWTVKIDENGAVLSPAYAVVQPPVFLYLILFLLIILIIAALIWYIRTRGDPVVRATALDLLEELRFTIRRLGVKEVVMPDHLTNIVQLERLVKKKRFEEAIPAIEERLEKLKSLEESFDKAYIGIILLEGDNSRLRGKGVVFMDKLEEINRLFSEGSYDRASERSYDSIDKNRAAELLHDTAKEDLASLINEIDRIHERDREESKEPDIRDYWGDLL